MAYGFRGFYPFHLVVFQVKIVIIMVAILLFGWLFFFFFVEPILAHKEGNVIFRFIVFSSLSQQYLFALVGLEALMVLFLGFYTKNASYQHYSP